MGKALLALLTLAACDAGRLMVAQTEIVLEANTSFFTIVHSLTAVVGGSAS